MLGQLYKYTYFMFIHVGATEFNFVVNIHGSPPNQAMALPEPGWVAGVGCVDLAAPN